MNRQVGHFTESRSHVKGLAIGYGTSAMGAFILWACFSIARPDWLWSTFGVGFWLVPGIWALWYVKKLR